MNAYDKGFQAGHILAPFGVNAIPYVRLLTKKVAAEDREMWGKGFLAGREAYIASYNHLQSHTRVKSHISAQCAESK